MENHQTLATAGPMATDPALAGSTPATLPIVHDPLWPRLAAFVFDAPGAALPFTARLARDQGWSREYATRVVDEYRRFVYLCLRAGHPCTPSVDVDEAWHLHLAYTESYWVDLCGLTLGQPLHHGPTRGGREETSRYADLYARTLGSYVRIFGELPPPDVWPDPALRMDPAQRPRVVRPATHWVVRKPSWLRGRRTRAGVLGVALLGTSSLALLLPAALHAADGTSGPDAGVVVALVALLAVGCAVLFDRTRSRRVAATRSRSRDRGSATRDGGGGDGSGGGSSRSSDGDDGDGPSGGDGADGGSGCGGCGGCS